MRTPIVALAIGALLAGGLGPVAAASAAGQLPPAAASAVAPAAVSGRLATPSLRARGGAGSISVSWSKVAGAVSYRVEYSTKSTFGGLKYVDVSATRGTTVLKGLRNDVLHYVRVRAIAAAPATSSVSAVKKAMPDTGFPRELDVTVVPAGPHKVKVSWTGQGRATKVGVLAGSNNTVTRHLFRSKWYPATVTSIILTVPAHYRDEMGTGSGNPVHVKVATYNSLSAPTAMPTASNVSAAYRVSRAGEYAWAGATAPAGEPLRVATWNVKSVQSSAAMTGYTWKNRRLKVRNGILASGAALVATQEINTGDAGVGNGKRQWEDLLALLAPSGYAIANIPTPTARELNTSSGAQLYYRTADLERLDGGFVSPRGMDIGWPSGLTDRLWSWAKFRTVATGAEFYAASVHLPVDNGTDLSALRVREVTAIDAYLSALAGDAPIVLLGDLNSSILKSATGPDNALVRAGYYDAASVHMRPNHRNSTVNTSRQIDNLGVPGFPYTPYTSITLAARVDYIMTKNAPGSRRFVNQIIRTSTGKFDPDYQGSDHNLQWADIGIPKRG